MIRNIYSVEAKSGCEHQFAADYYEIIGGYANFYFNDRKIRSYHEPIYVEEVREVDDDS